MKKKRYEVQQTAICRAEWGGKEFYNSQGSSSSSNKRVSGISTLQSNMCVWKNNFHCRFCELVCLKSLKQSLSIWFCMCWRTRELKDPNIWMQWFLVELTHLYRVFLFSVWINALHMHFICNSWCRAAADPVLSREKRSKADENWAQAVHF